MLPNKQPIIFTGGTMCQAPFAAKYLSANGFNILGVLKIGLTRWSMKIFRLNMEVLRRVSLIDP